MWTTMSNKFLTPSVIYGNTTTEIPGCACAMTFKNFNCTPPRRPLVDDWQFYSFLSDKNNNDNSNNNNNRNLFICTPAFQERLIKINVFYIPSVSDYSKA